MDIGITADTGHEDNHADLAGSAPYWLGGPLHNTIVLIGCLAGEPVLCIRVDLDTKFLTGSLIHGLGDIVHHRLDTTVVIGYGDRARCEAAIGYQPTGSTLDLNRYPGHRTVLLRVDADGGIHRCRPERPRQWDPTGDHVADFAIDAMDAGHHAWGRWGVIDADWPLTAQPAQWDQDRARARRARSKHSADERLGADLRGVELWGMAADLPDVYRASLMGEALLDCRVLERAVTNLAVYQPRIDLWLWCSRTSDEQPHWAHGMAAIAALRACRGPAARALSVRQWEVTADNRTEVLGDAILNRASFKEIAALVQQRAWRCAGRCCADRP
jgi:hypothetical protein